MKELRPEPPDYLNDLTEAVIGAAIEVHRQLGPGYLEQIYERALCASSSSFAASLSVRRS